MALLLLFSILFAVLPYSVLGGVVCEELPQDLCAFAISSTAKRCVLESTPRGDGRAEYECRTSEVAVGARMADWIETDECVRACGVERDVVGISSDALLDPQFGAKLCSAACYQNCPNIVDLYLHLAAEEGVFLPDLCQAQSGNPRRSIVELRSSGVTHSMANTGLSDSVADPPKASSPVSIKGREYN